MPTGLPRIDLSSRETLTMEVARRLLDYFLSGEVEPGERIPSERRLAESLGVGRSLVREALKSLHLLGLLEVRQGDGTYLKRTDSELLPQVTTRPSMIYERCWRRCGPRATTRCASSRPTSASTCGWPRRPAT
jgi:DNA-binding FadR family transcriptional regulator